MRAKALISREDSACEARGPRGRHWRHGARRVGDAHAIAHLRD